MDITLSYGKEHCLSKFLGDFAQDQGFMITDNRREAGINSIFRYCQTEAGIGKSHHSVVDDVDELLLNTK